MNALTKRQLAVLVGAMIDALAVSISSKPESAPKLEDLKRLPECVELITSMQGVPFTEFEELCNLLLDMYNAEGRTEEELDLMNQPSSSPYIH
ncbi:hypothetical protein BSP21_100 [Bacillus phage BSP21]|nr:hypothetical protein BSP21_100 [Bacillus phage BSP21]